MDVMFWCIERIKSSYVFVMKWYFHLQLERLWGSFTSCMDVHGFYYVPHCEQKIDFQTKKLFVKELVHLSYSCPFSL